MHKEESMDFLNSNYGKWEVIVDALTEDEQYHFLNLCEMARSGEVGRFDIYNPEQMIYFYLLDQIENNPISYVVKFPLMKIGNMDDEDGNIKSDEIVMYSKDEADKNEKANAFFQKWCFKVKATDNNIEARRTMFQFATCKRVFVVSIPYFLNEEFIEDAKKSSIEYFQISQILHLQACDFCGKKIDVSMIDQDTMTCPNCNRTIIVRNQKEMVRS